MPGILLDSTAIVRRAAQELSPGAVVALGMGLPSHIPGEVSTGGVWFMTDSGVLGNDGADVDSAILGAGGNPVAIAPGGSFAAAIRMLR